ncbi:MAG: OsmC family protein [Saprospiraceae bacterium]|jgi:putative redox protein|nr:OsmC family protein [Saprospiraceae bacterium]
MATVINIKNLPEGFQSIITNGKHSIIGDEPISSKGTDLGMSPSELVLSGLALCKAGTVRYIARKKGWEIGEVKAQLTQQVKKSDGQLKTFIKVAIEIEGNISEEQKTELLHEADNCYIHRQLNGEWEIDHATEIIVNAESVLQ